MTAGEGQEEPGGLSEIYDALTHDAKAIVRDLNGGVRMWREAASANASAAGFLLILALTTYRLYNPTGFTEIGIIITAMVLLGFVLVGYSVLGFRRFFQLRRKYAGLFARAKMLD